MAEPIEMPFGIWTQVGQRNHVLDGVQIAPCEAQYLTKKTCPGMPDERRHTAVTCAKMAELIEKPFRLWTRVGIRKNVLHGGAHWRHLTNMIQPSMFGSHPKTAKPIAMPFGVWTLVGPRNHALNGAPCKSPHTKGQFLGKR